MKIPRAASRRDPADRGRAARSGRRPSSQRRCGAPGHEVVQTTVSRDIHELGLIKIRHESGRLVYAPPRAAEAGFKRRALGSALGRWAAGDRSERGNPRRRDDAARIRERARGGDRPCRTHPRRSSAPSRARTPFSSSPVKPHDRCGSSRRSCRRSRCSGRYDRRLDHARPGDPRSLPPASASASRSPAASTRAVRSPGCASRADPVRVHRRPRAARRGGRPARPGGALEHGAVAARLVDCREALVREGARRAPVRCVPPPTGGQEILQHDAARPRGHHHALVRAMREDGVHVFGDGSTHKGNDIQRFYRYGILANPSCGSTSRGSTRVRRRVRRPHEMSEYLRRAARRTAPSRRRRTAPTPTCSARRTRRRTSSASTTSMHIVEPIMGVAHWKTDVEIEPRGRRSRSRAAAGRDRRSPDATRSSCSRGQRDRRASRARHERSDREPRHRREEPRHLRGAGHGAAAHRVRAAALRDPQREHARPATPRSAGASVGSSTRASGSTPRRCC